MSLFTLTRDSDPSVTLDRLRDRFPLQLLESSKARVTYIDTFDWRLMDGGLTLTASPRGRSKLLTLTSDQGRALELRTQRVPAFAKELEDGPFQTLLRSRSKVRRLFPKAQARWAYQLWAILNADEKTVARIVVRQGSASVPGEGTPLIVPAQLRLLRLKGYDSQYRKVGAALRAAGASRNKSGNELGEILGALGREPERHSSSTVLPLDPGIRADEACKIIHRELLTTMKVNLEGVQKDWDSEFLHEFRVAGRRARSALSQIKGVFPEETVSHFGEELRWLGSRTGPSRDMDVYLLKIPAYQDALPERVRDELVPLVHFLKKKKRMAHRSLIRSLNSKRFAVFLEDWSEFLDGSEPASPRPRNAGRSVDAVASERILTVYRKILKKGGKIGWKTPPEALHEVRLDCKKLRYLMSFFQTLFPPESLEGLIKELKKLQENLGDFNDLQVQTQALRSFADEMLEQGVGPPATLMAMGQLMGQLETQVEIERRAFHQRFQTFARKGNRRRFGELFG